MAHWNWHSFPVTCSFMHGTLELALLSCDLLLHAWHTGTGTPFLWFAPSLWPTHPFPVICSLIRGLRTPFLFPMICSLIVAYAPLSCDLLPHSWPTHPFPVSYDLLPHSWPTHPFPFSYDLLPHSWPTHPFPVYYDLLPHSLPTHPFPVSYDLLPHSCLRTHRTLFLIPVISSFMRGLGYFALIAEWAKNWTNDAFKCTLTHYPAHR